AGDRDTARDAAARRPAYRVAADVTQAHGLRPPGLAERLRWRTREHRQYFDGGRESTANTGARLSGVSAASGRYRRRGISRRTTGYRSPKSRCLARKRSHGRAPAPARWE